MRYKCIVFVLRKLVNVSLDEFVCIVFVSSSGCDGGVFYFKLVDFFILVNCNGFSVVEKLLFLLNLYFILFCNLNLL